MTPRVLIFGAAGQVGAALQQTAPAGVELIAHDVAQTDIRETAAVAAALGEVAPHLVINCAGFTNVDAAESHVDEARAINALAPETIARAAAHSGVRFVHISTDYVFDGCASSPYATNAVVAPLSVYGATKLEGEQRVSAAAPDSVIVRTAWVHSGGGANFVRTTVRHLTSGRRMRVVDDQIGTPTRARHLAQAIWRIADRPHLRGILHFTDAGVASWFDVALAVFEALSASGRLADGAAVEPVPTSEYPTAARRPAYSVLDKHASWRALEHWPPHWRTGVLASTSELLNA